MKRFTLFLLLIIPVFVFLRCNKENHSSEPNSSSNYQTNKVNQKKPNIIILLTDDMGYGDLQIYGNPSIRTPHIDSLANEGIRFTSYEAAPWCVPSRTELMTGQYYPRVKFGGKPFPLFDFKGNGTGGLTDSVLTLAEGLKKAGYVTGMAGKWHLGYHPKKFLPTNQGFDTYLGLPYSNDYKMPYVTTHVPLKMYRDTTAVEYPVNQDSLTIHYTREAVDFIHQHNSRDKPFFFYLAYNMPHLPIHTTHEFLGKSEAGLYGDIIETIDWSVGQVLKALEEEQITDSTIVFFASDNGPWSNAPARMFRVPRHSEGGNWELRGAGNKPWHTGSTGPLRGAKSTTYEGGTRVPAMIRWPGHIQAHQVSNGLIANLDIYRTLLQVGGGKLPDYNIDGYNMMPYLTGESDKSPRKSYSYFYHGQLQAMRIGKWKLKLNESVPQLFNLNVDPGEHYNRAGEKPQIVHEIQREMEALSKNLSVKIASENSK